MASITANQKERATSEAAAAAEAKKSLNELGQEIINRMMPIFASLIGYVNQATIYFADFVKYLANSPVLLGTLGGVIVATTAAFVAFKVASTAAAAAEKAKLLAASFKEGGVKGALAAMGPLGSKGNPMHVIVVGGGAGGGGTAGGGGWAGPHAHAGVGRGRRAGGGGE
jgi:spermidine synthase